MGAVAEREKMPFEVTPFMPYLTRFNTNESGNQPMPALRTTRRRKRRALLRQIQLRSRKQLIRLVLLLSVDGPVVPGRLFFLGAGFGIGLQRVE